jgi:hypothetical protein
MPVNSKRKGKEAELQFAGLLKSVYRLTARRGCQYKGDPDAPDIIVEEMPRTFWEVKRRENFRLYPTLDKCIDDAGGKVPAIAYRKDREPWVVIVRAIDLREFCEDFMSGVYKHLTPEG